MNMSYCRFQNTLEALRDCYENLDEIDELSGAETKARRALIKVCVSIAGDYESEIQNGSAS